MEVCCQCQVLPAMTDSFNIYSYKVGLTNMLPSVAMATDQLKTTDRADFSGHGMSDRIKGQICRLWSEADTLSLVAIYLDCVLITYLAGR